VLFFCDCNNHIVIIFGQERSSREATGDWINILACVCFQLLKHLCIVHLRTDASQFIIEGLQFVYLMFKLLHSVLLL